MLGSTWLCLISARFFPLSLATLGWLSRTAGNLRKTVPEVQRMSPGAIPCLTSREPSWTPPGLWCGFGKAELSGSHHLSWCWEDLWVALTHTCCNTQQLHLDLGLSCSWLQSPLLPLLWHPVMEGSPQDCGVIGAQVWYSAHPGSPVTLSTLLPPLALSVVKLNVFSYIYMKRDHTYYYLSVSLSLSIYISLTLNIYVKPQLYIYLSIFLSFYLQREIKERRGEERRERERERPQYVYAICHLAICILHCMIYMIKFADFPTNFSIFSFLPSNW